MYTLHLADMGALQLIVRAWQHTISAVDGATYILSATMPLSVMHMMAQAPQIRYSRMLAVEAMMEYEGSSIL